ncbi:MAG: hypothetical protein DYG94_01940 [Leptolyngbya sp. PLA3]|nr:MAG: hypothetical protein EDM82_02615 [Cyanobacteria bacterium CYA]MCE7967494.1 hypothetical protein [Leptolyngbya sp. PL-A3]
MWSMVWPDWQRDALRRVIRSGPLSADALQELLAICRAKHGLLPATGNAPAAIPLAAEHIPGGAGGAASVSLSKLSGLQNVGRLPNDQEIDFGPAPGLTVIYGENGAGKSGYARILKKVCRARGMPQEIKPDAFAPAATGPAKASITFRVGTADFQLDWQDGVPSDPRLANIFVFDSFSARVHVGEDGPACFKPRGLDVLPELAKACDTLGAELKKEIDATFAENTKTAQGWKYSASTAVGKVINALGAATKPETIDAAAVFSDADEKRLAEIIATLSTDPKLKAADTTAAAKRIRTFAETAKNRVTSVDDTAMQALGEAIKEAETTAKAANAAAGPELRDSDLPGSCNDVWRRLWDAAKAYSVADAYPGKTFPVTEADAKCVLCQQPLQADAIDRYARFNKFVANETRKQADAAKAKVTALRPGVDSLRVIGTEAAGIKADLDREAAGTFAIVEAFAKAVDVRIAHAQTCLKVGAWTDAPALPKSPCADLLTLADKLDKRAKDELAAADPEKAKALATERDELTDKKWLAGKKDEVKAQIARHAHAAILKKVQADCASRPVSDKAKELDKLHVTEAFCKAFARERDALGLKTLPVSLSAVRVAKGESQFAVVVDGAATANVEDIASEGEHRCIALAAFFAELSQASHKSALVFDDPVSSLDHKRRDAIAARLVKEASHRQVVVFTHDLAFVCDLDSAARSASGNIYYQHIEWLAGKPGRVLPGLVWDAQSFKEQMKTLNEQIGHADSVYKTKGESEYREAAMPVVGRIRGACERIIEQHMLNGVIKRHDSRIDVKNTPSLAAVTVDQWKAVHAIWKECSNIIEGHATPLSGPVNVPTPEKLKGWIKVLEDTVEAVRTARSASGGTAMPEIKPAPAPAPHA